MYILGVSVSYNSIHVCGLRGVKSLICDAVPAEGWAAVSSRVLSKPQSCAINDNVADLKDYIITPSILCTACWICGKKCIAVRSFCWWCIIPIVVWYRSHWKLSLRICIQTAVRAKLTVVVVSEFWPGPRLSQAERSAIWLSMPCFNYQKTWSNSLLAGRPENS